MTKPDCSYPGDNLGQKGWKERWARPFRILYRVLLSLARAIGRVNTFLLLCFSFYGVLMPIALVRRLFQGRRTNDSLTWQPREPLPRSHFKKQY